MLSEIELTERSNIPDEVAAWYRSAFDDSSVGMAIIEAGSRFIRVNTAYCNLVGYSREELLDLGSVGVVAAEDFADHERCRCQALACGSSSYRWELRLRHKDGHRIWVELSSSIVRDKAGSILYYLAQVLDVRERRRAEEGLRSSEAALRAGEAHFRTLAQNSPDYIVRYDLEGRHLYVNPAAERAAQRSAAEMYGKTHEELGMPAEAIALWSNAFRAAYVTRREQEILFTSAATGTTKHYDARFVPELGPDGTTIVSLLGITRDVTAAKEALIELRRQKALLETQTEASLDGILTVSPQGEIISYNHRFARMWSIDTETLDTRSDEATVRQILEQLADPITFLRRIDYLYAHPDEESFEQIPLKDDRIFERYSAPARGKDGTLYGRIWFFRDVTVREEMAATLRASEERFRALTENSLDIISILAPDGTALYVCPSLTPILGYTPEELLGAGVYDLVHPEDHAKIIKALTGLAVGSSFPERMAYRFRHKDGSWRWMESMGSNQLTNPAIKGIVVNTRDVTERKRLEQQMIHTEKLAALGQLVAGVAHEINNPLAAISGYAQLLKKHADVQVQEDATVIDDMVHRADRIVRALRSYSRGNGDDERQMSDINEVIQSALNVISHQLRRTDVATVLDFGTDLPSLKMNTGAIEQVIVNLLSNAEQALRDSPVDERQIRITTRVQPKNSVSSERKMCVLEVHDSGSGIPESVLSCIFDPFFTTKETGEGTGLGLYISHGIITAHGGMIEAQSREGVGTTMTVLLPVEPVPTAERRNSDS